MANYNSIPQFREASTKELQDAAGITQFPTDKTWFQVINGLQIQGGFVAVTSATIATVNFEAPYEKQLLGVFLQVSGGLENGAYVTSVGLNSFQIANGSGDRSYYWWAIGV